jgi:hypothetical protein
MTATLRAELVGFSRFEQTEMQVDVTSYCTLLTGDMQIDANSLR